MVRKPFATLQAAASARCTPQKRVWRAKIAHLSAHGIGTSEIMRQTGTSKLRLALAGTLHGGGLRRAVARQDAAFADCSAGGGCGRAGRGTETERSTCRSHALDRPKMANEIGISASSVQCIWRAHGLRPHRVHQCTLSTDPKFVKKLRDVVGLYVDPPAHAMVLSSDEKSQIQALDPTRPGLPMKKGAPER
jgi:hypothetical protein